MEKQAGQNSVLSAIRFAACSCVGKHEGRGRSQERTIKRWFGYTHFLLKGLEKVRTEWRFTPKAFGADDAGLQPQTGVEPGELREIDASSGSKSSAKRLKRGGRPFFSFVGDVILPDCYPDEPNLWKTKTGDLNFRTAGQTFSPPATRAALEFSHRLANC